MKLSVGAELVRTGRPGGTGVRDGEIFGVQAVGAGIVGVQAGERFHSGPWALFPGASVAGVVGDGLGEVNRVEVSEPRCCPSAGLDERERVVGEVCGVVVAAVRGVVDRVVEAVADVAKSSSEPSSRSAYLFLDSKSVAALSTLRAFGPFSTNLNM